MGSWPGTQSNARDVRHVIAGFSNSAVAAGQLLAQEVVLFPCQIGAIGGYAYTAGSGTGNTVLDVLVARSTAPTTFTSIFATLTGNRPTLASASTGGFVGSVPGWRDLLPGDVVVIEVLSIPSSTGHARVTGCVALEDVDTWDWKAPLAAGLPRP